MKKVKIATDLKETLILLSEIDPYMNHGEKIELRRNDESNCNEVVVTRNFNDITIYRFPLSKTLYKAFVDIIAFGDTRRFIGITKGGKIWDLYKYYSEDDIITNYDLY
jgi:hypothetical protein